jgi:uncharacterized protein involved in oxidation of intracellular sulfur
MEEQREKIVYIVTCAGENPEKASLPFVMANAALAMDVDVTVILQGTGVYLAKKGYLDNVFAAGLPPLKELVQNVIDSGGKIYVCVPCIKERKIAESDLMEGAQPVAAGVVTEELLSSKAQLVYGLGPDQKGDQYATHSIL